MTITHGFLLLFLIGLGYALSLFFVAALRLRLQEMSGEDGRIAHAATADFRTAGKDVLMGLLFVVIVALPLFVPVIGIDWFRLLQQTAFILLGVVYVLGMAFARLHQLKQP